MELIKICEQREGQSKPELTGTAKIIVTIIVGVVLSFATFISGKIWSMGEDIAKIKADLGQWTAIQENREAINALLIRVESKDQLFRMLLEQEGFKIHDLRLEPPEGIDERVEDFRRKYYETSPQQRQMK